MTNKSLDTPGASTARSVAPFQSAFRSLKTVVDESFTFKYELFEFRRIEYHVDTTGVTTLIKHTTIETVEVVDGWQRYKSGGIPAGGYLSKGLGKYAFRVSLNLISYIIISICDSCPLLIHTIRAASMGSTMHYSSAGPNVPLISLTKMTFLKN